MNQELRSDEEMVLLTERCTASDCGRVRYGELTDDANTHWHVKRGVAIKPVSDLPALADARAERDEARQRADRAEAERDEARAKIAAVEAICNEYEAGRPGIPPHVERDWGRIAMWAMQRIRTALAAGGPGTATDAPSFVHTLSSGLEPDGLLSELPPDLAAEVDAQLDAIEEARARAAASSANYIVRGPGTSTEPTTGPTKTAAELLSEAVERDPEGHRRRLGNGYGVGPEVDR